MNDDFFSASDAAVARANNSTVPEEVAGCNNILIAGPLTGSIAGMAMRYATLNTIAVNERLDETWQAFALWHELGHIFCGHVNDPSFNFHQDRRIFAVPVDSRTISIQEREANIISAEYNICSDDLLELSGYYSQAMADYRELKKEQQRTLHSYNRLRFSTRSQGLTGKIDTILSDYKKTIRTMENQRLRIEEELISMNCIRSLPDISRELGTSETILKYKIEALRIRGYDIDGLELELYNKVFNHAL